MHAAPGESLAPLLAEVRACQACAAVLPHAPRPVLQAGAGARVLIAGQAPGAKVQASGVPFDDASGARLREWMGVERSTFYDPEQVAILPMGFCYPGPGRSGDAPPRPECAPLWRARLLAALPRIKLTLLIGHCALRWHLPQAARGALTPWVRGAHPLPPGLLVLPHPSGRNNIWLAKNPWFAAERLPALRAAVREALGG